jgi:hypothetical protein
VISKFFLFAGLFFGANEKERERTKKVVEAFPIQVNVRACSEGLAEFFLLPYLLMIQDLPKNLFVLLP